MSEQITISVSVAQAYALVDAITCLQLAADGDVSTLTQQFMPGPDSADPSLEGDACRYAVTELAFQVFDVLKPEIDAANARDPDLQEFLHRVKMLRKYDNLDADAGPLEP